MRMDFLLVPAVIFFLGVPSTPVLAANTQFLSDTPLAKFSKADRARHMAMLQDLLSTAADGEARRWEDPDSEAGAEASARTLAARNGQPCRELTVKSWHKTLRATNSFNVCESKDGAWKLAN